MENRTAQNITNARKWRAKHPMKNGWNCYNRRLKRRGKPPITLVEYVNIRESGLLKGGNRPRDISGVNSHTRERAIRLHNSGLEIRRIASLLNLTITNVMIIVNGSQDGTPEV